MVDFDFCIVGKRIHELRLENGLSQTQLGKALSVSQDTVSLWEKSKSLPPVEIVVALAKLFDVSCDFLLGVDNYNNFS